MDEADAERAEHDRGEDSREWGCGGGDFYI